LLVGQHTLHGPDAPLRHGGVLGLGANDRAFAVFERHWRELDAV
jgi:hypothetical protein